MNFQPPIGHGRRIENLSSDESASKSAIDSLLSILDSHNQSLRILGDRVTYLERQTATLWTRLGVMSGIAVAALVVPVIDAVIR